MTRAERTILFFVAATALVAIVVVVIFVSPRSPAVKNQNRIVGLLAKAQPEFAALDRSRIQRINLGKNMALMPEQNQVAVGYILRAHVLSSSFTIEAQPMKPGETGLFSYFRDEAGVIRFETDGKRASAGSRPLNQ
jgi:hypothetical protein